MGISQKQNQAGLKTRKFKRQIPSKEPDVERTVPRGDRLPRVYEARKNSSSGFYVVCCPQNSPGVGWPKCLDSNMVTPGSQTTTCGCRNSRTSQGFRIKQAHAMGELQIKGLRMFSHGRWSDKCVQQVCAVNQCCGYFNFLTGLCTMSISCLIALFYKISILCAVQGKNTRGLGCIPNSKIQKITTPELQII